MKSVNDEILSATKIKYSYPKGTHNNINLTTIYPGLVIGSGYTHALKENSENFNFGFFFDHTTGMPIIPGSTVKGILSSMFGQGKNEKYKEQKEVLIKDFLNQKDLNVTDLHNEIFRGISKKDVALHPYQRDIFYDAYVKDAPDGLLKDDYITPHANPLKDPVPNRMLKLAPNVTLEFCFDLHDGIITAEQKEELFLQLLSWHGVGVKTNVGYGQFKEYTKQDTNAFKKDQKNKRSNRDIECANGFDKFLLELEKRSKIDDKMVKFIKDFKNIEKPQQVMNIVESKVKRDDEGKYIGKEKFYKQIVKLFS